MSARVTFSPSTGNTDPLTFANIASDDSVYGAGTDTPRFISLGGVVFEADFSTGIIGRVVTEATPGIPTAFRRLAGTLSITEVS